MRINDILQAKGNDVVTVAPHARIRDLVSLLADHNVGALVVSHDGEAVEGIVSERDVVRRLRTDPDVLDATVDSIMTSDVASCDPHDSVDALMRLMTNRRVRHVPVIEDGALRGIVSIGDVVKSRIGELEFERDQLNSYVANAQ